MNTKKWYHLFLLTGFMMLVSLGMSVKADAATIMDLERKFPNGAYWNHVVLFRYDERIRTSGNRTSDVLRRLLVQYGSSGV